MGAAIAAGIGTGASFYINSQHYDIHYNRELTCLFVIGGSVLAGAAGGYLGALTVTAISSEFSKKVALDNVVLEGITEDGASEVQSFDGVLIFNS